MATTQYDAVVAGHLCLDVIPGFADAPPARLETTLVPGLARQTLVRPTSVTADEQVARTATRYLENWKLFVHGPKGQVVDLAPMLSEYYRLMGWDTNGVPTPERLQQLGLGDLLIAADRIVL